MRQRTRSRSAPSSRCHPSSPNLLHLAAESRDQRLGVLDVVVRQPQKLPPQIRRHLGEAVATGQRQRRRGFDQILVVGDAEDFGKAGDRLGVRSLFGLGDFGGDGACWSRSRRVGTKANRAVQL